MESKNGIKVQVDYDKGCDLSEGQYSLVIIELSSKIDISDKGSDIRMIQQAVYDWLIAQKNCTATTEAATIVLDLAEDIEQQGKYCNKYYDIVGSVKIYNKKGGLND